MRGHQAFAPVGVGGDEAFHDRWVVGPEHQHRAVGGIGERTGEDELAAFVRGVRQREVLGTQRRAPFQVVVDELVDEQPVHDDVLARRAMVDADATKFMHETMPFAERLGMAVTVFRDDEVEVVLDWSPSLCTSNGMLHGGVLMALADTAGAGCAFRNLPAGAAGTSTIESKTNFLGAVRGGTVRATARPLHVGSTTIVAETEVRNDDRLVAKVTQTQIVLMPRC